MLIIVEGPDGSGKTTLLNYLSKKTGIEIIHGGGPPKSIPEIYDRVVKILDNPEGLYDRVTMISERIYGPVVRKARLIDEEQWNQWTARLGRLGAVVIYCRPPDQTIREFAGKLEVKGHKSANHIQRVRENIQDIIKFYDHTIRKVIGLGVKVITYDRTTKKIPVFYKELVLAGVIPAESPPGPPTGSEIPGGSEGSEVPAGSEGQEVPEGFEGAKDPDCFEGAKDPKAE